MTWFKSFPIYDPTEWHCASWYAFCIVYDTYERPLKLNCKLQDYAVNYGVIFG